MATVSHLASICTLMSSGVGRVPEESQACLRRSCRVPRREGVSTNTWLRRSLRARENCARRSLHSLQNCSLGKVPPGYTERHNRPTVSYTDMLQKAGSPSPQWQLYLYSPAAIAASPPLAAMACRSSPSDLMYESSLQQSRGKGNMMPRGATTWRV